MENFCYHGIGTNLLRYESILKYGILTKDSGTSYTAFSVNSSQAFNGNNNISIVIPHEDTKSGAINIYVFNGISFLITNEEYSHAYYTNSYSGIFDEGYVDHPIPPSNLSGIIIPTHLKNKRISELSLLKDVGTNSVVPIAQSIINTLIENGVDPKSFTDTQDLIACYDTINNDYNLSFDQRDQARDQLQIKLDTSLGQKLESYYQEQLGKQDITLIDVIDFYNQSHLPIYDENDVQEQCNGYTHNIPLYIRNSQPHNNFTKDFEFETMQESPLPKLREDLNSPFKRIARKQNASVVNKSRTTLTSYMNQLHNKHKLIR